MLTNPDTYRLLYEDSPNAIFVLKKDGTILDANQSALDMCGYSRVAVVGKNIEELLDRDGPVPVSRGSYSEPAVMERLLRRSDGSLLSAEIIMKPVAADVVQCICRDATNHQSAGSGLYKKWKVLEEAERLAHVGAWEWNATTDRCSVSDEWLRLTGSTDPTPSLHDLCPIAHPDDCSAVRTALDEALQNKAPYSLEHRIIRKDDGTERIVQSFGVVEADQSGKPIKMHGALLDVTDRKRVEDALRQSEQQHRLIFDYAPVGLVHVNQDGRVTACNDKSVEIFSASREAIIGLDVFNHVQNEDVRNAVAAGLAGRIGRFEGKYRSIFSEREMHVRLIVAPMFDVEGAVTGCTAIIEDFTDVKRSQDLLLQAEGLRAIADLTGGVAHNFNNLLQVVMGNASLALMSLEAGDSSEVKEGLEAILSSSTFAAETIRRLAEFSSLRLQLDEPETEVFDFCDVVQEAIHMTRPFWQGQPEKKGIIVKLHSELTPGSFVSGHSHQLFEVAVNLIRNAAEAVVSGGEIHVRCGMEADEVVLRVKDNGIGIPENDLARVFTPFYTTKMDIGSGLGLATSRAIVEQHRGNILVSSVQGVSTEFSVYLPLQDRPKIVIAEEEAHFPTRPLIILAIDDMEPVVNLLKKWLSKYGHEIITALNGRDGLRTFEERRVDLVICDLAMPAMNGWEVGEKIKEGRSRRDGRAVPFILLTGWNDQADDKARIEESGVAAVVQKPIKIQELLSVIARVVGADAPGKANP